MEFQMDGDTLIIRVPLTAGTPSKTSGKNLVRASTGGFQPIPQTNMKLNLMVIAPR